MATLSWRSCTSAATNLSSFISSLKSCPAEVTPFSDIRVPLAASTIYLCVLALLSYLPKPSFARSRPFVLLAVSHNLLLSLASLIMFIGAVTAALTATKQQSFAATFCTRYPSPMPGQIQFWIYVFYLSKFYELLDTPILVLRNRPLILLHVWHHTSVALETWAWLEYGLTMGIHGMIFNTFVHVFMYAYYAAALLKIRLPKKWITVTQIVQFLASFASVIPWAIMHSQQACTGSLGVAISAAINASYLLLFVRFYKKAYGKRKEKGS